MTIHIEDVLFIIPISRIERINLIKNYKYTKISLQRAIKKYFKY
jgi:hypothetical protein